MGCGGSKATDAQPAAQTNAPAEKPAEAPAASPATTDAPAASPAAEPTATKVKIHGMPPSQNCCGPVLLAMEAEAGGLEFCDLMSGKHKEPEFLAVNPFSKVPAMEDGEVKLGESNAILRYLANKYKKEAYPDATNPELSAEIDFAMDAFVQNIYPLHSNCVYFCMGFAGEKEDTKTECPKKYLEEAKKWADRFLAKGKFVGGSDTPTIADYKVIPFFFAASQPRCKELLSLELGERLQKYQDDFFAAVKSANFLKEAGGFSIAEFTAKQGQ